MAYNPYADIQKVYNAKVNWGKATTDAERKAQNDIANAARQTLKDYGYGYVADQISAYGADTAAVKKILDSWADKVDTTTNTFKSGVENPAYNQSVQAASDKNDKYFNTIESDHKNLNKKYDDIYNYANQDITETDEYKAAFKNIMPSYTLAAMQGRDNEVASNAGSNGGNIDSFAAANAMRQQASLTAKGQALAHQTGIESYEARVNNVRNILSDLGVYNSSVYSAMSDSINQDRGIANDIFNNEQTALNNDVARKSEIANVTGYVPNEWVVSNNPYLDDNGKLKDEYKNVDFSAVMADAKAKGNTEVYNAAATARFYKIMGDYATYGQYDDGNYALPGSQRTAEYDLTQQQIASAEKIAKGENDTKLTLADKEAASAVSQIKTAAEYGTSNSGTATYQNGVKVGDKNGKPILTKDQAVEMRDSGNASEQVTYALNYYGESVTPNGNNSSKNTSAEDLTKLKSYFTEDKIIKFIDEVLKPYVDNSWEINEDVLEKLIVGSTNGTVVENSNSEIYNLDVEDARKLCNALGLDASWVDKFTNRTWFNAGKGMKSNN